jgi:hypothetical protein
MGAGEPLAQLSGGLVGRVAIERHQRGRDAGCLDDAGAPSIEVDEGDLNQIGAPRNGFFEAMWACTHREWLRRFLLFWDVAFYASGAANQAKRHAKLACTVHRREDSASGDKEFFLLSGNPQEIHAISTVFPQLDALMTDT